MPYYSYTTLTPTDGAASLIWTRSYALINNANIINDAVESPSGKLGAVGKRHAQAEARFFRADVYNNLATLFGKVPLIINALTAPKTDFLRASLDDINSLIVSDLTYAGTNLYE